MLYKGFKEWNDTYFSHYYSSMKQNKLNNRFPRSLWVFISLLCVLNPGTNFHSKPSIYACTRLLQCLTVYDPIDCSQPGSSVHGTLQARILERVAMPSSRGSSQPRDQTPPLLCLLDWLTGSLPLVPPWKPDKPRQHIQNRDITLLTQVCIVNAMVFPVVMYGYESWTIKKTEWWTIDTFKLGCWRRFLTVPWTARRSNQPVLKEINPLGRTDAETKAPILWPPNAKGKLIGKDPDAGKDWGQEETGPKEDKMVR